MMTLIPPHKTTGRFCASASGRAAARPQVAWYNASAMTTAPFFAGASTTTGSAASSSPSAGAGAAAGGASASLIASRLLQRDGSYFVHLLIIRILGRRALVLLGPLDGGRPPMSRASCTKPSSHLHRTRRAARKTGRWPRPAPRRWTPRVPGRSCPRRACPSPPMSNVGAGVSGDDVRGSSLK